MLQQILRDMWVDPEILAELDDTQKQTLFCKMREEQVRRWRLWDQKLSNENGEKLPGQRKRSTTKKSVQFLQDENGEPWVWVMGEHTDDRSIEDILLEEAKKKAQQQAQIEAEQLRKSVERELTHLIDDYKPLDTFNAQEINISPKQDIEESMEIYCSVDELRQRIQALEPELKLDESEEGNNNSCLSLGKINGYNNNEKNLNMEMAKNTLNFNFIEGKRDVLQELSVGVGGGGGGGGESVVGSRVAAWERRVASARAGEILRGLRQRRAAQAREAEKAEVQQNTLWREQERKAKEAEYQIREIARRAREEHRRSCAPDIEPTESCCTDVGTDAETDATLTIGIGKPRNREAVVDWFRKKELPRGAGLDENRKPADWFHGLITRSEAEQVLKAWPPGSYLVRLSERIWGYAISYRASQHCKHYLVDAASTHYQFLGDNQKTHRTLGDLVKFHSENAITESGQEKLLSPCLVQASHTAVQQLCS